MGGTPCRAKIILNGARIQAELKILCYQIQEEGSLPIPDDIAYKMVELLNEAEDNACKATRLWLESQGFHGTEEQGGWPHSLDFKKS